MLAGRFTWPDVPLTWVMAQFRVIEVEVIATADWDGPGQVWCLVQLISATEASS